MYIYEMDPIRTVGATEQTLDAGWTDGAKLIYNQTTSLCGEYDKPLGMILFHGYIISINRSMQVFIHIFKGYFTGIEAGINLPQCQWSNPTECA